MTIENQRNKKNTHLGEALGKHLPPLTLEEFTKYLEESKGSKFKDEASRYFIEKYPMIQNDPHMKSTMLLIGVKMLVVEGTIYPLLTRLKNAGLLNAIINLVCEVMFTLLSHNQNYDYFVVIFSRSIRHSTKPII